MNIAKGQKLILKRLHNCGKENNDNSKKIGVCQGLRQIEGRMNKQSTVDFWSSKTIILYDSVIHSRLYVIIHQFKSIEYTTPRVNPNETNSLWMIMICRCRCIDYIKCTILVREVDILETYMCGESVCVFSAFFQDLQLVELMYNFV